MLDHYKLDGRKPGRNASAKALVSNPAAISVVMTGALQDALQHLRGIDDLLGKIANATPVGAITKRIAAEIEAGLKADCDCAKCSKERRVH